MIDITDVPTTVTAPTPKPRKSARKSQPGLGSLINLALMVWMIWDLRKRSDAELNGKRKWWLMAAFVPPFGPIAYIVYLRQRKTQAVEIPVESTVQV